MALQSLAPAPFRVVDEINQGMDPRNERMVHERMIDVACRELRQGSESNGDTGGRGSQYFLITPKLLHGLEYHRRMKIHCIASGEYMPAVVDGATMNGSSMTIANGGSVLDFGKILERKQGLLHGAA